MTTPPIPASPASRGGHPVILFDGVCNLCNGVVQWVIEQDGEAVFRFASLQSHAAKTALRAAGVAEPDSLPDSIALLDARGVHVRSDAAIGIGRHLGFPYRLISVTRIVPRVLRDVVYDWVARNRYRWFGRRETCMMPTPDRSSRFLDGGALQPTEAAAHAPATARGAGETAGGDGGPNPSPHGR